MYGIIALIFVLSLATIASEFFSAPTSVDALFIFTEIFMKKFLTIILSITFIFTTLFACTPTTKEGSIIQEVLSPLKLDDSRHCTNTTIKASASTYVITPAGFDLEELNKRNYKMRINVTYDVYYTKDWDVLWDIGYLGAPKYEVFILDDDLIGKIDENITAPSNSKTKTITYSTDIVNLIGSKIYLTFSSDNIQNKIHFKNISVTYSCYK